MPISLAICLFRRPAATWTMISRSRGLSVSKRSLSARKALIIFPPGTIASEAGFDSVKEVLIAEWLGEKLDGTALHRLDRHRHVGVRCDKDDRELPVRRGQLALKLETALPRQSHVEHQAAGAVRRISLEKIGNRRKLPGLQADRPQETRNRVAKLGIVIDDQDTGICVTHPGTLR